MELLQAVVVVCSFVEALTSCTDRFGQELKKKYSGVKVTRTLLLDLSL